MRVSRGKILAKIPNKPLGRMTLLQTHPCLGAEWQVPSWASPSPSLSAPSVKFLLHVSSLMCDKIGAVAEAFAALGAFVGLLSGVDSLVYDED